MKKRNNTRKQYKGYEDCEPLTKKHACTSSKCSFTSNSSAGLAIHFGQMHKRDFTGESIHKFNDERWIIEEININGLSRNNQDELFEEGYEDVLLDSDKDSDMEIIDNDIVKIVLPNRVNDIYDTKKSELYRFLSQNMSAKEVDFCLLCTSNGFSMSQANDVLKWKETYDDQTDIVSLRGLRTLYKVLDKAALLFFPKHSMRSFCFKIPRPGIKRNLIFSYENPSSLLIELLMDPNLTNESGFNLRYCEQYGEDGLRRIGEFHTGNWWRYAESKARNLYGNDTYILPFILFSDKTDVGNKRSVWPIYITLGNFGSRTRNKLAAKLLVGFIPKLENRHLKNIKDSVEFTNKIFNLCYKQVLDDLASYGKGTSEIFPRFHMKLPFEEKERKFLFVPMLLPSDHEERVKHGCLRMGQTNRPCPNCLVTRTLLRENVCNANAEMRSIHDTIEILRRNSEEEKKLYSLKEALPAAWKWFEEYNPHGYYYCLPACFLHVVHAVSKYLVLNIVDAIKYFRIKEQSKMDEDPPTYDEDIAISESGDYGLKEKPQLTQPERLSEMENRLADFSPFTYKGKSVKVFRLDLVNGGTKLTCTERVELLYQLKYVLSHDVGTLLPQSLHWKVFDAISSWEDVLQLTWRKPGDSDYSEKDIGLLYKSICKFKKNFKKAFTAHHQSMDRKILFHALDHFPIFIFLYGHPKNCSTGSFEHWHTKTKRVFLRTQRQYWDCGAQMIQYMRRIRVIQHFKSEEEDLEFDCENRKLEKFSNSFSLGKEIESMHDDVPLNRVFLLLSHSLESFGFVSAGLITRHFKRVYYSSIVIASVGKIYAMKGYGKQKTPLYSDVLLDLSREEEVSRAEVYNSMSGKNKPYTIKDIIRGDDEILVFAKVYGIFRLTGKHEDDGRIFVMITYYVHVNSIANERLHSKFNCLHLRNAIDPKNDKDRLRRWWDVVPIECIVKKVHLVKDHGSIDESRFLVNWDPVMH